MSVGFPTAKLDIDAKSGQLALQLRQTFDEIEAFQAYLDSVTTQNLVDKGYTEAEVSVLKSAYTDLDHLRAIYEGSDTQSSVYDFRTFAHQLTGLV